MTRTTMAALPMVALMEGASVIALSVHRFCVLGIGGSSVHKATMLPPTELPNDK